MPHDKVPHDKVTHYKVALPLGTVLVTLDRTGLGLGRRGGFSAEWTAASDTSLTPEAYRREAKRHLQEVYRQQEKSNPPSVTLNLASHQLLDDLIGWTKLNYPPKQ